MEELKAANKQLECEAAELLKERSSHKQALKKDAHNAVGSLQNEIAGLKMELAQSREKGDYSISRMGSILNEKNTLEEEVKALRERTATHTTNEISCLAVQQTTNNRIRASTG
eukprot:4830646-Ditylum_brightwellii.AAC.1